MVRKVFVSSYNMTIYKYNIYNNNNNDKNNNNYDNKITIISYKIEL